MGDLTQRNQLLYEMHNHITGKKSVICAGYTNNIIATLTSNHTRDFCFHYMAAFVTKRLGLSFEANDYEVVVNRGEHSINLYRRKTPFKEKRTLDFSDLQHIATLQFWLVPSDREYDQHALDVYHEHRDLLCKANKRKRRN